MSRPTAQPQGCVFVISSPSGGGKTTIVREVERRVPGLVRSVSVTTRAPRAGERDGQDYRFISPAAFARMRATKALLEWANVHGAQYGTPRRPIDEALARGQHVMLSIDVQGARKVRRALGDRAVLVFLLPPSLEQLERRLHARRTDSGSVIKRRLAAATKELACAAWYDHTIVNDELETAITALERLIRGANAKERGWHKCRSKSC